MSVMRAHDRPLPLPEAESKEEPKPKKKLKTKMVSKDKEYPKEFREKVYMMTIFQPFDEVTADMAKDKIEDVYGVDIAWITLKGIEGYFIVDESKLTEQHKKELALGAVQVPPYDITIQECLRDDLEEFYDLYGKELNKFFEGEGIKKRARASDAMEEELEPMGEIMFDGRKFRGLKSFRNMFELILRRLDDGQMVTEKDKDTLLKLLSFDESNKENAKGIKNITVGRCFYITKEDGSKEELSLSRLIESFARQGNMPQEMLQEK